MSKSTHGITTPVAGFLKPPLLHTPCSHPRTHRRPHAACARPAVTGSALARGRSSRAEPEAGACGAVGCAAPVSGECEPR
eukprot:3436391-Prymnesium_polylepis.1